MPDITMCSGNDCPLKENCYRYKAKPSEFRQSYFIHPPYDKQKNECHSFWDMDLYFKIKKENNNHE